MRKTILAFLFLFQQDFLFGQTIKEGAAVYSSKDSTTYKLLKCGLYQGLNGDIAYRAEEIYNDSFDKKAKYITWIYGADRNDSLNAGLKEMKYVVDTQSFHFLNSFYWADKKNIYCFTPMSDGGTIYLCDKIDRKTFALLGTTGYAKDKGNIYYKGVAIENADIKTFKVLSHTEPDLAYDKFKFYKAGEAMKKEEVEALQLNFYRK